MRWHSVSRTFQHASEPDLHLHGSHVPFHTKTNNVHISLSLSVSVSHAFDLIYLLHKKHKTHKNNICSPHILFDQPQRCVLWHRTAARR